MGRGVARWLLVSVFLFTALFHAAAIAMPSLAPGASPVRHAVFVVINGVVAGGLVRRPRWFVAAFGALTVQQMYSHGGDMWQAWASDGRVDWMSLAVLVVMPLTLIGLATRRL